MDTRDIIDRALNKPETEIDKKWAEVARNRLKEMRQDSVKTIHGEEVFEKVWKTRSAK